ncbi:hypothetical protein B0J11DRAFT_147106 [Dendryphion nanum]|uniref:Uncharacterized protein n=1 Tax=Dendryphion nanum TaxID=256645 RepID=A0A9P9IBB3_9PLEO|nr:hypothetical protein B0J11DRAFT_147106 [Dendryphion nanum]
MDSRIVTDARRARRARWKSREWPSHNGTGDLRLTKGLAPTLPSKSMAREWLGTREKKKYWSSRLRSLRSSSLITVILSIVLAYLSVFIGIPIYSCRSRCRLSLSLYGHVVVLVVAHSVLLLFVCLSVACLCPILLSAAS